MGHETENPEITAWALETAASVGCNFEGRWRQSLDFAVEGARLAPIARLSARVMNLGKQLITHGRMRNIHELERVLEVRRGRGCQEPDPHHPDNHFVFDAAQARVFLSATAYAWPATMSEQHRTHAMSSNAQVGRVSLDGFPQGWLSPGWTLLPHWSVQGISTRRPVKQTGHSMPSSGRTP